MSDGLMRMSVSAETAMEWTRISIAPSVFIIPFGLLFTLRYTGWNKKIPKMSLLLLLFLPSMLIELMVIARLDKYFIVKSEKWNWIVNPEPTMVTNAIYLWISIPALMMLALLWLYYFKVRKEIFKKNKVLLLAIGFSVPVLIGITTEMIFPLFLGLDEIPLSAPLLSIFSISAFIAIKKYSLLGFSPRHQWEKIVETMNEGILIVNNHDRVMYANKRFCSQLEYEYEELQGKLASELLFEMKTKIGNAIEDMKDKRQGQNEIQLKTKSGKRIWMLISSSPYLSRNGKVIGSIGMHTEITARKKNEAELKNNHSRLNHAQAIAHLGSWQLDLSTGDVLWSDEACRIYGLLPAQNKQTFESWLSFLHPGDFNRVMKLIMESHRTLSPNSFDHQIIRKDGSVRFVHSECRFEFDQMGNPIDLHGIALDITERKKSEEKLISSNRELETFIYRASHDLRGPLTSIMGLINLSKMEITDEKSQQYLNMIDTSTKRLDGVLIGLVNTMRIKDTKIFNDKIDFTKIIPEILKKNEHLEAYSKMIISNSVAVELPFFSSRLIIESIFENMIENAIKYQNHVTESSLLKIAVSENDKIIQIVFQDNGIGIDASIHDKIFEMYFRGEHQPQGSGLGLYIVSIGIEKLGGGIELESKKGHGTKFIISLPRKPVIIDLVQPEITDQIIHTSENSI